MPHLTAEDRLEIRELLHRYMFILDAGEHHGNGEEYADLYVEDGAFGANARGRDGLIRASGRAADGSYNVTHTRGPQNQIHINVGEIIVPTEEGARGTSYLLMIDGPANQVYWAGWYEDEYVKTPKGWRFKSRVHVAGTRAGIPANAADIRRAWERQALAAMDGQSNASAGQTEPQPIARDPLNWVDGKST